MTIDEAIAALERISEKLDFWILQTLEEVAMNMLALVVNRIQQQGLPGRDYSDNPLPPFFYEDRALNAGGRALLARKDKKALRKVIAGQGGRLRKSKIDEERDGISYKEWRAANGLQTAVVDLTFTGRMFQNLGIVSTSATGGKYSVVISGLDKEVRDKLRWNAQRYGDFFVLTADEKTVLVDLFKKRLKEHFQSAGL